MRLALLALALLTTSVQAALPAQGWPQPRRDAALTGRSDEPALPSARLKWIAQPGDELTGEPAVVDCTVAVTASDGSVHAYNARSGAPLWTHARAYVVTPTGVASALAIDDAGVVNAGLPADPLLDRALRATVAIYVALEGYAIDNNAYPPGPDLAAALTPTYMRTLPPNPATGAAMQESDAPSVGDYRYSSMPNGDFHLAVWGSDGGLLDLAAQCGFDGFAGLDPSWPVSAERGGTRTRLDLASGSSLSQDLGEPIAVVLTPSISGPSVDWAADEDRKYVGYTWAWDWWWSWGHADDNAFRGGSLRRTTGAAVAWSDARWGGARGAAAHDGAGDTFLARGASRLRAAASTAARTIATAVESYSIDNNRYPATGDLEGWLTPTYLRCMPPSLEHDGPMTWGSAASGADYGYASPDGLAYVLDLWDEDGGVLTEFDTGSVTVEAEDRAPTVVSLAPDGTRRWRTSIGIATQDVTPVALSGDSVIVGTTGGDLIALDARDGSERWRVDVGEPLSLPPALLPDGGPVVVTNNGTAVAHDPSGGERWRRWLGATVTAAPSTTADGVTYVADLDGSLRALAPADGAPLWSTYLGGVNRAGLSTTPVQSHGWIYVGRTDGALVAVVPRETAGRPSDPVPLMATGQRSTTSVGWTWAGAALPADPGAHWHLLRWRGSLTAAPDELLAPHPSAATGFVDLAVPDDLAFYSLLAGDCGENLSASP